jgi:hypothetical protein
MRRGEGSGYRGVSWNKVQHEWTAQLNAHGRTHYLGRFDMPLDAAKAYDAAARRELGPSAKVRPSRVGLFTNIYIYMVDSLLLPSSLAAVELPRYRRAEWGPYFEVPRS